MKKFKNMTELNLYKQKLKYKESLMEEELAGRTADLVEYFSNKLQGLAFDLGKQLLLLFFKNRKQKVDLNKEKI